MSEMVERRGRTYTVQEIEDLRRAVDNKFLFGSYKIRTVGNTSRPYHEADKVVIVEEKVRTFMLAGLTADDLRRSESE